MQDLIGRTLGHYRIVDKIGEGGFVDVTWNSVAAEFLSAAVQNMV